ncbi:MAG: TlpA family protein disulfide reductase [Candidatus Marinimicrobia bacterium]|nr:TlpA family protein disulfide reductase [Candidatus Neomarinimicrobiota bacterium]
MPNRTQSLNQWIVIVALGLVATGFSSPLPAANRPIEDSAERSALHIKLVNGIDLDGNQFQGSSLEGKIVLLDFWAVWCGPCLAAFPALKRLSRDFNDRNFEVIGIASYSGTRADVQEVVEQYGVGYTIILGEISLITKFGVIGLPTYFLMGPDGTVARKYVGEVKDLYERISADIGEIINSAGPLPGAGNE